MKDVKVSLLLHYMAFLLSGGGGLVFIFICARHLGLDGLGVVTQVMALYLIIGQVASGGIQFSALHVAGAQDLTEADKRDRLWSSVFVSLSWGGFVAGLSFLGGPLVTKFFSSPVVGEAWLSVAPALVFFSFNKCAASTLNGLGMMERFSGQLALRGGLLAFWVYVFVDFGYSVVDLCLAILVTEVFLSLYLFVCIGLALGAPSCKSLSVGHAHFHVFFGAKSIWSALSYEVNARVDLLMVGVFLSDSAAGLYGVVAQISEGFFSILIVLKNHFAPIVARVLAVRDTATMHGFVSRSVTIVTPAALVLALLVVAFYNIGTSYLLPGKGYEDGALFLGILLSGWVCVAWVMPFDSILVVSGNPGAYSLMMVCVVATNVFLNLALLPVYGLAGAAFATAISALLGVLYFVTLVRIRLGFWLSPWLRFR